MIFTQLNSSGGSRGAARGGRAPPLFLDQTEARRAETKNFGDRAPLYLRVWMTVPSVLDPALSCIVTRRPSLLISETPCVKGRMHCTRFAFVRPCAFCFAWKGGACAGLYRVTPLIFPLSLHFSSSETAFKLQCTNQTKWKWKWQKRTWLRGQYYVEILKRT